MLKTPRKTRKSPFLFPITLLLVLLLSLPWVSAEETDKPKLQPWQIDGIMAALDDSYPKVKGYALGELAKYELQDWKSMGEKKPEDVAKIAANLLKDKNVDNFVRSGAAYALGNLAEAAKPHVKDILDILKDKSVDNSVRSDATYALENLAEATKPYVKDILDILKDKNVDPYTRSRAAQALGNLGDAAKPYVKDIADILKDKSVDYNVRFGASQALGNLGDAAKPYVKDIIDFLKDKSVDYNVRSGASQALGNLGNAAKPYVKDIIDFLKDKTVESYVRSRAAEVLGKLGDAAKPYVKDILNFLKDKNVDNSVRSSAAKALENLGDAAKPYVKDILNFLKDKNVDNSVRSSAAEALGKLGKAAKPYVKDILNILKDESVDNSVRYRAAETLGKLGDAAKPYIKDILKDESVDYNVRYYAAETLGKLGDAAKPYIKDIADILKDESVNSYVRSGAAQALGNLGDAAKPYVKDILDILKDKTVDSNVRYRTAQALGNLGDAAKPYVKDILEFVKDESVNSHVRSGVAEALGKLGDAAKPYVKDILNILKDKNVDNSVRSSAAEALGNLGDAAKPYVKDILNILKDKNVDNSVRSGVAEALGNLGDAAKPYVKDIADILQGKNVDNSVRVLDTLGKLRKLEVNEVVVVLNNFYEPGQSEYQKWRFLTYFYGGGTDEVKTLLKWLGESQEPPDKLSYSEGVKTLQVFLTAWEGCQDLQQLQADLARQIAAVTRKVTWKWQDINLLQSHYKNLKAAGFNEADTVHSVINNLEFWQWFFLAKNILLIHLAIWLTLILAYPKSPQVQTIFWNPWVRCIGGFGYIGLLLTWVPYLRRRLFEPFKPILLADAGLGNFNEQTYFPESFVKVPPGSIPPPAPPPQSPQRGEPPHGAALRKRGGVKQAARDSADNLPPEIQSVTQALPDITGQIVLEGDSGLGKSMFLRHLVKTSQRIVAYLPAQKCDNGIIEAIYTKLQGQVQDAKFLRNLIYNGAIDICIDGLNEVTADTRAKVSQFAESYFRGNIIMTTQPLDWIPPSTAKKYELQPLEREQIQQFLISRQQIKELGNRRRTQMDADEADENSDNYEQACFRYIAAAFNDQQSPEDLAAAKRILSNPMDLTLVALMLSQGKQPDLFRLQEQQYQLMAEEYLREWNHEFPLKKFSQAVYQMRLNDESAIPAEEFNQELISMEDEKYKMVVSRQWQDADGEPHKSWYFRHDKIMEFFLVQNFLGESEEVQARVNRHIDDPRFRGVYLLLANLLPLDDALELRERLIEYAATTKDHTLTDIFVQLLQLRLPRQLTQDGRLKWKGGTLKQVLRQQEQKTKCLNLAIRFLELVGAKIKREKELHLTIETIEGSLSPYTPLPVLLTVETPTDQDIIQLVQISKKLILDNSQRVGILFYKVSPDTTARIEMAKVRLRDHFVLIPIPLAQVEQALPNPDECRGLLEVYCDRYLQRVNFFDDKNAISDTFSFFGRTELLQRLGEELLRYQGIGLFGLRKSGKTSMLFQLGFMLREHPIIHIDLQRYGGSRYYGAALFNDILHRLSTLESEIIPHFQPFPQEKPAKELTVEFIQKVNDFARTIGQSKKYKLPILCFLDEVERIIPTREDNREKAEEFNACFGALRVLCQEQRQLSLLVADVHPDCNRINSWTQQGVATNPVFSFFKEIFLSPFSEDETKEMLTNIGKLMELEFDEQTPKQIHWQSGGHPFVSRQLARFLTEKIRNNNQDKNTKPAQSGNVLIRWAMVERYLEKTLTQKGELKNYLEKSIWEDLEKRKFEVAIALLQVISCNEHFRQGITEQALLNQLRDNFTESQCLDACLWLTNVGLLDHEEVEHQDFYQIRIPLLSRWIQMQMTQEEIEQCQISQNARLITSE